MRHQFVTVLHAKFKTIKELVKACDLCCSVVPEEVQNSCGHVACKKCQPKPSTACPLCRRHRNNLERKAEVLKEVQDITKGLALMETALETLNAGTSDKKSSKVDVLDWKFNDQKYKRKYTKKRISSPELVSASQLELSPQIVFPGEEITPLPAVKQIKNTEKVEDWIKNTNNQFMPLTDDSQIEEYNKTEGESLPKDGIQAKKAVKKTMANTKLSVSSNRNTRKLKTGSQNEINSAKPLKASVCKEACIRLEQVSMPVKLNDPGETSHFGQVGAESKSKRRDSLSQSKEKIKQQKKIDSIFKRNALTKSDIPKSDEKKLLRSCEINFDEIELISSEYIYPELTCADEVKSNVLNPEMNVVKRKMDKDTQALHQVKMKSLTEMIESDSTNGSNLSVVNQTETEFFPSKLDNSGKISKLNMLIENLDSQLTDASNKKTKSIDPIGEKIVDSASKSKVLNDHVLHILQDFSKEDFLDNINKDTSLTDVSVASPEDMKILDKVMAKGSRQNNKKLFPFLSKGKLLQSKKELKHRNVVFYKVGCLAPVNVNIRKRVVVYSNKCSKNVKNDVQNDDKQEVEVVPMHVEECSSVQAQKSSQNVGSQMSELHFSLEIPDLNDVELPSQSQSKRKRKEGEDVREDLSTPKRRKPGALQEDLQMEGSPIHTQTPKSDRSLRSQSKTLKSLENKVSEKISKGTPHGGEMGLPASLALGEEEDEEILGSAEMMATQSVLCTPLQGDVSDTSIVEDTPQKPRRAASLKRSKANTIKQNIKGTPESTPDIFNFIDDVKYQSTPFPPARKSLRASFRSHTKSNMENEFLQEAFQDADTTLIPLQPCTVSLEKCPGNVIEKSSSSQDTKERKVSICCSCLSSRQTAEIRKIAQKYGWDFKETFSTDVTHLIISVNENNRASRSVKYLMALATHKFIVSPAWVQGIDKDPSTKEEEYEVLDESGKQGPHRLRTIKSKMFKDFTFFLQPPSSSLSLEEFKFIVTELGGKVVDSFDDIVIKQDKEVKVLVIDGLSNKKISKLWLEHRVMPVNLQWVLESLCRGGLRPLSHWLGAPPQLLPQVDWPQHLTEPLVSDDDDDFEEEDENDFEDDDG